VPAIHQSGLIPAEDLIPSRHPYGSKNIRLSFEGRVSTSVGLFSQVLPDSGHTAPSGDNISSPTAMVGGDGDKGETGDSDGRTADDNVTKEARALKRQRQWRKWSADIIPALLQPYMSLLRETEGLRDINTKRQGDSCPGCSDGRLLEVTCVYFDSRSFLIYFDFFS